MEKRKKKAKINLSILIFFPTIYLAMLKVYTKLKTLALIGAEKSVTEILIWQKEKRVKKGNGKQEEADSLLHNTTSHTEHCTKFQNSRCSSSWENFDGKKSLHPQTNIITEKIKTI